MRTALVTGASRGIGRAVARHLAADGALVAVHFGSNGGAAAETVTAIEQDGGKAFSVCAELGANGGVQSLFAQLEAGLSERVGEARLDVLVNNASVIGPRGELGSVEQITAAEFDRVFAVNVRAPLFVIQRALPLLRDGGRIVNISSLVTRTSPTEVAYAMSKGAVDVMGRTLAVPLGARGITVNTVAPGIVETDMMPWVREDPGARSAVGAASALGRVGRPVDIAGLVAYLASDEAGWVTGQVVDATGGLFLRPGICQESGQ